MIAIIDYEAGNIRSVENALERLGADYLLTADPERIAQADHVILPGVGEAAAAMRSLRSRGLDRLIPTLRQPVLGICIGLQLMCRHSEEGDTPCLGVFDHAVRRLADEPGLKIPHIGWNTVEAVSSPLLDGLGAGTWFYFVHSYAAGPGPDTQAETRYGTQAFSAVLGRDNFYGTQFHPEKSGSVGERLLKNFIAL